MRRGVVARRAGLLVALVAALAGCSVDRVEWESSGFPVEEVAETLEHEYQAEHPEVECIKREVAGALWECRAHAGERAFECEVHVGVREAIRKLHCAAEEHEEGAKGDPAHEEEGDPADEPPPYQQTPPAHNGTVPEPHVSEDAATGE
jgi:hypothetical protein